MTGLYAVLLWAGLEVYRVAIWVQLGKRSYFAYLRPDNSAKNIFHE